MVVGSVAYDGGVRGWLDWVGFQGVGWMEMVWSRMGARNGVGELGSWGGFWSGLEGRWRILGGWVERSLRIWRRVDLRGETWMEFAVCWSGWCGLSIWLEIQVYFVSRFWELVQICNYHGGSPLLHARSHIDFPRKRRLRLGVQVPIRIGDLFG